jgi:hypothetical protein
LAGWVNIQLAPTLCQNPWIITNIAVSIKSSGFFFRLTNRHFREKTNARSDFSPGKLSFKVPSFAYLALGATINPKKQSGATVPNSNDLSGLTFHFLYVFFLQFYLHDEFLCTACVRQ